MGDSVWNEDTYVDKKDGPDAKKPRVAGSVVPPTVVKPVRPARPASLVVKPTVIIERYVVTSTAPEGAEEHEAAQALLGEFVQKGTNHGRKVYQKCGATIGKYEQHFIYYWDKRDGPAFAGWWFGDKVGGSEVRALCKDSSLTPPRTGWKIPWTAKASETFTLIPKEEHDRELALASAKKWTADIEEAIATAKGCMLESRESSGDFTSVESINKAGWLLGPKSDELSLTDQSLREAQLGSCEEALDMFAELDLQLGEAREVINTEIGKLISAKAKIEEDAKIAVKIANEGGTWEKLLAEILVKSNAVEDSVQKALAAYESIESVVDDPAKCKCAVDQTESLTRVANTAIGEGRIFVNMKIADVKKFTQESVRNAAATKVTEIQQMIKRSQEQMKPLKEVRVQHKQREEARQVNAEFIEKITVVEKAIEGAEEAKTDQSMSKCRLAMLRCNNFLEAQQKVAAGKALEELEKFEKRVKAASDRLDKLQSE